MKLHDVVQRSTEWHALRLGTLCSSYANAMLAGGKGTMRGNLLVQLALERLTKKSQARDFQSEHTQNGVNREEDALFAYQAATGRILRTVGYVSHDSLMAGGSPDGVLGEWERVVEAKCPTAPVHWEYFETGVVPLAYLRQIRHLLWLTNARGAVFISFNPDFPERGRLRIVEVSRDEQAIEEYDREARAFLAEVDRKVEAFHTLTNLSGVLSASVGVS